MKQKGLAPIVIVVLIAAVASLGGFLIYSQQSRTTPPPQKPVVVSQTPQPTPTPTSTPDANRKPNGSAETANWKTYTNKEFNFSFKYPPEFGTSSGPNIVVSVHTLIKETFNPRLIVTCAGNFTFGIEFSDINLYKDKSLNKVNVGDKEAWRYDEKYGSGKGACSNSGVIFYTVNNSKNRILHLYTSHDSNEYENLFDQILSTFKFTN